jgi:L-aminoadipate-semialdehyde dehydrogenase
MDEFLSPLEYYGYRVPEVPYTEWKDKLETFVSAGGGEKDAEQHALMPLYHFCVNDLPANTKAPELDDRNAVKILKADAENWTGVDESAGYGISREDIGRYLSFLAETGFVPWPTGRGRPLPDVELSADMKAAVGAVGGRGGVALS